MNSLPFYLAGAILISLPHGLCADDRGALSAKSMAYVLQPDEFASSRRKAVRQLAACNRDLIVLDDTYDATSKGKWTPEELDEIRLGKRGRKVVAYLSIGEAEDYRPYWQPNWDANKDGQPDEGATPFLDAVNPDWEGNYKVRYWHPAWQKTILKTVDAIRGQGFDGLYLDIVDAFEFYEYDAKTDQWFDQRNNPETGKSYRQDMVEWVQKIAQRSREKNPNFLMIPQNGVQLLAEPKFLETIDAIGIEDLFTEGDTIQPREHIRFLTHFLEKIQKTDKPLFLIEYGEKQRARNFSVKNAESRGMTLLLTNRELTILGEAISGVGRQK